jgi:hypothetical protein
MIQPANAMLPRPHRRRHAGTRKLRMSLFPLALVFGLLPRLHLYVLRAHAGDVVTAPPKKRGTYERKPRPR